MPPKHVFINNNRRREREEPAPPIPPYLPIQPPLHWNNTGAALNATYNWLRDMAAIDPNVYRPRGNVVSANNQLVRVQRWLVTITLDNNRNQNYQLPDPRFYAQAGIMAVRGNYETGNRNHPIFGNHRHIQLYVETNARVNWMHIFMAFGWGILGSPIQPSDVWMAPAFSPDRQQAIDYVMKDETRDEDINFDNRHPEIPRYDDSVVEGRIIIGDLPGGGVVNDHNAIRAAINEGADFDDIVARFGNQALRYSSAYIKLINEYEKKHAPEPYQKLVTVFWGEAGTGKTRAIFDEEGHQDIYSKPGGKFFEGYQNRNHRVILFDDYVGNTGNNVIYSELLKILDRYPYQVEIKYGAAWIRAEKIYITSNKPPYKWFNNLTSQQMHALYRRFNGGVFHWSKDGKVEQEHFDDHDYESMAKASRVT